MDGKSLALLFALVAAWFILNRWVLPFFGVSTCMSCGASCQPINRPAVTSPADSRDPLPESALDAENQQLPSSPEVLRNNP